MKYVMTLEHCPNPDIGGYYQYPVDKKPIKAIGSSYKEMRDKFYDWRDRNDLGSGNMGWIVVSFVGKDKLIKPIARFSYNGRLWELNDNDDSFNTSDPRREICIDIDDDKETMDKYATGEIKAVEPEPVEDEYSVTVKASFGVMALSQESANDYILDQIQGGRNTAYTDSFEIEDDLPEPVKPELSKSFNMCDECMETNETQDYSEPMYYNIEQNVFECLNGHTEDPINHFRQDSRDSLFDIVMGLLGANPSGTCQVYGRKNRPVKPEPVLATRHSDNEVIDVTLTEDEAFEEGFRQGKLTNDQPEPVKPPTNFDHIEKALESEFSLHDVGHIMGVLNLYRTVEVNYEEDEEGFNSFIRDIKIGKNEKKGNSK